MIRTKTIEGVTYYRFVVAFKTTDGKRHRRVHWSPGPPWLRGEVARGLDETYGIDRIAPRSCVIGGPT